MTWHIGRQWVGHRLEDECPCVQAPCGLVYKLTPGCPQHSGNKTLRQSHRAEDCPGAEEGAGER